MSEKHEGGCLCGAIRYSFEGDPLFAGNCHCSDCQKWHGAAYFPAMGIPEENFTLEGELKFFDKPGDSGKNVSHGFCPNCGSSVLNRPEFAPHLVILSAATLDDASLYQPMGDFFTDSAQHWDVMSDKTPKYPRGL